MIHTLESRRLLAFNAGLSGGTLQIVADNLGVNISITTSGENFRVVDANDGSTQDVPQASVARFAMFGGSGPDRLRVAAGINLPSTLSGGAGNDTLIGGGGADVLIGGSGADSFTGNGGGDLVDYSASNAPLVITIDGIANDGAANEKDNVDLDIEQIAGGSGNDSITGSIASNVLMGNGGKDTLRGGAGDDTLSGGNKNDLLDGGGGKDFLVGSAGTLDAVDYSSRNNAVSVSIDDIANDGESAEADNIAATCEVFFGGNGDDLIIGSGKPNRIVGGAGNDTLRGGSGNDTLEGGSGTDSILGESGNDLIDSRDLEFDSVNGGSGIDVATADVIDAVSAVP